MSAPNHNTSHSLKLPPIHKLVSDVAPTSEVLDSLVNDSRPDAGGTSKAIKGELQLQDGSPQGTLKKRVTSQMLSNNRQVSNGTKVDDDTITEGENTELASKPTSQSEIETQDDQEKEKEIEDGNEEDACGTGSPSSARSSTSSTSSSSEQSEQSAQSETPEEADEAINNKMSGFGRQPGAVEKSQSDFSRGGNSDLVTSYSSSESDSASDSPMPEKSADSTSNSTSLEKPPHVSLPVPLEPNLARNPDLRIPVYSFMESKTPGASLLPNMLPRETPEQSSSSSDEQNIQNQVSIPQLREEQSQPTLNESSSSKLPSADTMQQPGSLQQGSALPQFYYPYTPAKGLPQYQNHSSIRQQQPLQPKVQLGQSLLNFSNEYGPMAPLYAPGQQQLLYYAPPRGVDHQIIPIMPGTMQNNATNAYLDPSKQPDSLAGPGQGVHQQFNSSHPEFHIIDSATGRHLVAEAPRRRGNLPKDVTNTLRGWLTSHLGNPYPTEEDKMRLVEQTGLSLVQVSNWFINARRRSIPASQRRGKNHNYSRSCESRSDVQAQHQGI